MRGVLSRRECYAIPRSNFLNLDSFQTAPPLLMLRGAPWSASSSGAAGAVGLKLHSSGRACGWTCRAVKAKVVAEEPVGGSRLAPTLRRCVSSAGGQTRSASSPPPLIRVPCANLHVSLGGRGSGGLKALLTRQRRGEKAISCRARTGFQAGNVAGNSLSNNKRGFSLSLCGDRAVDTG